MVYLLSLPPQFVADYFRQLSSICALSRFVPNLFHNKVISIHTYTCTYIHIYTCIQYIINMCPIDIATRKGVHIHCPATFFSAYGLKIDTDVYEPHRANQILLYNAGLLEDIFSLLQNTIDLSSPKAADLVDMYCQAFTLLRLMMMENSEVQIRVSERVDVLLDLPSLRTTPTEGSKEARLSALLMSAKGAALAEVFTSARVISVW